jgi:hypothetical protein
MTKPGKLWPFKLAHATFTSLNHTVFSTRNMNVHNISGEGGFAHEHGKVREPKRTPSYRHCTSERVLSRHGDEFTAFNWEQAAENVTVTQPHGC